MFLKFSLCVTLLWKTVSAHFRISLFSASIFYSFNACKTAVIYIHGHKENAIFCTYDIVLPRIIGCFKILKCEEHRRMVCGFQKIVIYAIDSSQNTKCLLPMKQDKASWFFFFLIHKFSFRIMPKEVNYFFKSLHLNAVPCVKCRWVGWGDHSHPCQLYPLLFVQGGFLATDWLVVFRSGLASAWVHSGGSMVQHGS